MEEARYHKEQYASEDHDRTLLPDEEAAAPELVSDMLPHAAAGIAILAADLSLSSWNSRAEYITGYTLEAVASRGLVQMFEPGEVMQHMLNKVQQVQDDIPTLSEYLYLRHAHGHLVPVTVQCSPQRHRGRNDGEVVVAFRELEPLHQRLRRDRHQQMLGRLASSLSHEVRNPLNAIFLHVDILDEELRQPTPHHRVQMAESLADIRAEITRLNDLVQDYLSLARLSDLHREPVDLGALVESFSTEMQEHIETCGITLRLEGLDQLGQCCLHRHAFRRALLHLVQNAIHAMPQGGTLTIRGTQVAGQARLAVSDTGSGIPQEQFPLLFTPFHTTKPEGTGLGLYVVQQIVDAHEGHIDVTSTPDTGTTFTLTLPCAAVDTSSQT